MVTPKALRHYDAIGLLHPAGYGEDNSYRYYETEQIQDMLRILQMKEYGFSLEEVRQLLNADDAQLLDAMQRKLQERSMQAHQLNAVIQNLKTQIEQMQKGNHLMKQAFNVEIVETQNSNLFSVREHIDVANFDKLFGKMFALLSERGLKCIDAPIAIYHCEEFDPKDCDVELGCPVAATGEQIRILAGSKCAKAVHRGAYDGLNQTYLKLGQWIEENGYKVVAPPYEKYISDPAETKPEDLITELYFPIG